MSNLQSTTQNANLKTSDVKVRAYRYALAVVTFVNTFPNKRAFWIIGDQLLRAATSIGANMIEAQAASSKRDFIKFYEISLKSCNECKYWLGLVRDTAEDTNVKSKAIELLMETNEIANMLGASVLTLKGKR